MRGPRRRGLLGQGAKEGNCMGKVDGWWEKKIEKHQWERKPKMREVPEKAHNETSGGHFICGFGCLMCCKPLPPLQERGGR